MRQSRDELSKTGGPWSWRTSNRWEATSSERPIAAHGAAVFVLGRPHVHHRLGVTPLAPVHAAKEILGRWEPSADAGGGVQPVVPDLPEPMRERVEEEPPQELVGSDATVGLTIAGLEHDGVLVDRQEPAAGDGHAVRVQTEGADQVVGPPEGLLRVDDPGVGSEPGEQGLEGHGMLELGRGADEAQLSCVEQLPQAPEELASEQGAEDPHREEELGSATDPAVVLSEATSGDDAVHVWVVQHLPGPGVQHGGDAGEGIPPIRRELQQRGGGRLEQQIVESVTVGEVEGAELLGLGEHHVEVVGREGALHPALDPPPLLDALADGAVSVPAGVVGVPRVPALVARVRVASHGGSPAIDDVAQDTALLGAQHVAVQVRGPEATEERRQVRSRVGRARR